jgi:hypothetical protein
MEKNRKKDITKNAKREKKTRPIYTNDMDLPEDSRVVHSDERNRDDGQ